LVLYDFYVTANFNAKLITNNLAKKYMKSNSEKNSKEKDCGCSSGMKKENCCGSGCCSSS